MQSIIGQFQKGKIDRSGLTKYLERLPVEELQELDGGLSRAVEYSNSQNSPEAESFFKTFTPVFMRHLQVFGNNFSNDYDKGYAITLAHVYLFHKPGSDWTKVSYIMLIIKKQKNYLRTHCTMNNQLQLFSIFTNRSKKLVMNRRRKTTVIKQDFV